MLFPPYCRGCSDCLTKNSGKMTLGRKVQIICDPFYGKLLLTLRDDSSPLISSLQIKILSQG